MTELELLSYKNRSHISCLADNCFLIFDFCQRPTASANAFAHINSAGYAVYFKQSGRLIAQLQNPYQRVRGSRGAADGRRGSLGRGRGLLGCCCCRRWCRFGFASQNLRLGRLRGGRGSGEGSSSACCADRTTGGWSRGRGGNCGGLRSGWSRSRSRCHCHLSRSSRSHSHLSGGWMTTIWGAGAPGCAPACSRASAMRLTAVERPAVAGGAPEIEMLGNVPGMAAPGTPASGGLVWGAFFCSIATSDRCTYSTNWGSRGVLPLAAGVSGAGAAGKRTSPDLLASHNPMTSSSDPNAAPSSILSNDCLDCCFLVVSRATWRAIASTSFSARCGWDANGDKTI